MKTEHSALGWLHAVSAVSAVRGRSSPREHDGAPLDGRARRDGLVSVTRDHRPFYALVARAFRRELVERRPRDCKEARGSWRCARVLGVHE
jgi:hypothetical protein